MPWIPSNGAPQQVRQGPRRPQQGGDQCTGGALGYGVAWRGMAWHGVAWRGSRFVGPKALGIPRAWFHEFCYHSLYDLLTRLQ